MCWYIKLVYIIYITKIYIHLKCIHSYIYKKNLAVIIYNNLFINIMIKSPHNTLHTNFFFFLSQYVFHIYYNASCLKTKTKNSVKLHEPKVKFLKFYLRASLVSSSQLEVLGELVLLPLINHIFQLLQRYLAFSGWFLQFLWHESLLSIQHESMGRWVLEGVVQSKLLALDLSEKECNLIINKTALRIHKLQYYNTYKHMHAGRGRDRQTDIDTYVHKGECFSLP